MPVASTFRRWISERLPKLLPGGERDHLPVVLHRKRIYILPTRHGVFFAALLLVMLLGALNYNNNLALLLTYLLSGLLLMATFHTYRNLAGLEIASCSANPVFAGSDATVKLVLKNSQARWRCMVRVHLVETDYAITVAPEDQVNLVMKQGTATRGWQSVSRIRLYSIFPLGFFCAWSWLDDAAAVLVYPRPEPGSPPLPRSQKAEHGAIAGESDELKGFRPYRPGDPMRLIGWKALARTDQLWSKEFEGREVGQLWFDFNELNELDLESRLSRLARWIQDAEAQKLSYGLILPDQTLAPAKGEHHYHRCLRALALFNAI